MIQACVFDAFGTLFNLDDQLLSNIEEPNLKEILAYAREKQLSYTWLRSLMHEYQSFEDITKTTLKDACHKYQVPESIITSISTIYFQPVIFDDVLNTLQSLKELPVTTCILSNGTHTMLQSGIQNNQLENYIDRVYSADDIKIFKPHPSVYSMVTDDLNIKAENVLFISSNQWDVAGAAKFGFNVAWVNRNKSFRESITDRSNVFPISSLNNLIDLVG